MTVYLVGAGPGDPGLITVRGAQVLSRADIVFYDRLSVASLLDLAPANAERVSVGKTPRGPSTPQDDINAMLIEHGRAGRVVVRLKGGDPFVFGRGGEEATALAAAGVPFEVVPGISSAIAVPAYAGVPVTQRGVSTSFTVVTGSEAPWSAVETDWDAVAKLGGTIVVLMGTATRGEIAERLMRGGLSAETPVVSIQAGTRPDQRTVRTTLAGLGAADVRSSSVTVIGDVAALNLDWFERRPLFGKRVVVTRAPDQAAGLRQRLTELGAGVLEVPTIEIAPASDGGAALAEAAKRIASYAWVVFTSPNAVERVAAHLRDARAFGSARVAAMGRGTASVLQSLGVVADFVPSRAVGEWLADEFPSPSSGDNTRVLLPQAAAARAVVRDGLRAKGWDVDVVEAYATRASAILPEAISEARTADAITFTSSSTVESYVASAGVDALPPIVVCIGPVTADAARASGVTVAAVADPHTIEGLVTALVVAFGELGAA